MFSDESVVATACTWCVEAFCVGGLQVAVNQHQCCVHTRCLCSDKFD